VYAALGRYYFLNNANIWIWGLYGNKNSRGLDALDSDTEHPEYGGRVQLPTPRGEIAISYHHRTATSKGSDFFKQYNQIDEDRVGIDGKWDLGVGLWFEASYNHKAKPIGIITDQTFLNVGTDYTFGIGNGLNVVLEHLAVGLDENPFEFNNVAHVSAALVAYPLGFFDNLSSVMTFNWVSQDLTFFMNYQHQFKLITTYVMVYYNPDIQQGLTQNELVNTFSGPGVRVMLVYNH
jgi:hypothetical protein